MTTLDNAIALEQDGADYYRKQGELNKGTVLEPVCNLMAEEEENHKRLLTALAGKKTFTLPEVNLQQKVRKIFKEASDVRWGKDALDQETFYREAIEKEEASIALYSGLQEKSEDKEEMLLLNFLIKQEEKHKVLLEELSRLLRNAEEWVESPEFGLRRESY